MRTINIAWSPLYTSVLILACCASTTLCAEISIGNGTSPVESFESNGY